jgi:glycosyltransferase involved in cell wall biosynthesis
VVEDTSSHDFFALDGRDLTGAQARYIAVLSRSKFVLCPRGEGTSSFRMFEALACGRVPVVLSDGWIGPAGINWSSCSVRIREADVASVAARLEMLEPRWPSMSAAARAVYDEWFAPDVWFHQAIEQCNVLRRTGAAGVARQWPTVGYWRAGARHLKHIGLGRRRRSDS